MLRVSLLRAESPRPLPLPAGVVPSRAQRVLYGLLGVLGAGLLAALWVRRW